MKMESRSGTEIYPCEFSTKILKGIAFTYSRKKRILFPHLPCAVPPLALTVRWSDEQGKALDIDRFGVNVDYLRRGLAVLRLTWRLPWAGELGACHLRLFVVDINETGINLCVKNGSKRQTGVYEGYG